MALDVPANQLVASLNLSKGQQSERKCRQNPANSRGPGLPGFGIGLPRIREVLIELAIKDNLHWLEVEIVTEMKGIIKAFQSKGFHIQTIIDDYFTDIKGTTFDVALMMRSLITENDEDF